MQDPSWKEELYKQNRVIQKIELLEKHLPEFLVENKALYGILSTGIHSLKENECLEHFETVKIGIEFILDEKLERFEKARKLEEAKKKISFLNSRLKSEE